MSNLNRTTKLTSMNNSKLHITEQGYAIPFNRTNTPPYVNRATKDLKVFDIKIKEQIEMFETEIQRINTNINRLKLEIQTNEEKKDNLLGLIELIKKDSNLQKSIINNNDNEYIIKQLQERSGRIDSGREKSYILNILIPNFQNDSMTERDNQYILDNVLNKQFGGSKSKKSRKQKSKSKSRKTRKSNRK
jgi:hypothetical protein